MLARQLRSLRVGVHLLKEHRFSRTLSSVAEDGVIRSPFQDVEIPNVTISEYVWENLDKWEDRTAVVCGVTGHGYTYERLFRVSTTLAANLRTKLGLQDGDCAAIMLPNSPDFPVVTLATIMAGGTISGINPVYTAHEVSRQLLLSDAKMIFTDTAAVPTVKEAINLAKINIPIIVLKSPDDETWEGTLTFNELSEDTHVDISCLKKVRRKPEDVALLPYSSGTTGLPKGVEITHRNLVANCQQLNEPRLSHTKETTNTHQDVIMAVLPFFHTYGNTAIMWHKLSLGAKIVTLPRFHPEPFLKNMKKHKTNILYAAPPMVLAMTSHPLSSAEYLKPLELVLCGAAPLPQVDVERLFDKAQRKFIFRQAYGLTETSPMATVMPADVENYSSVGYPVPNTQLKIVDGEGKTLPEGQLGELLIRGPQVMRGYRQNPEATAAAIRDGWFHSGDLATSDDTGAIYIKDRLKELIKVKGYQVAPAELESVLREHPSVLDAAVVGVTNSKTGESPRAFVVPKDGLTPDAADIKEFVKQRVAPYKRIEELSFVDSIPKNPSGKILRKDIKAKYC